MDDVSELKQTIANLQDLVADLSAELAEKRDEVFSLQLRLDGLQGKLNNAKVRLLAQTTPAPGSRVPLSGQAPATPDGPAPQPIDPATGQHKDYWVLSEEERQKGFVRPVRRIYRHVGTRPKHPLRDLTAEELIRFAAFGYVAFEAYPESGSPITGRYWTEEQLSSGCGEATKMAQEIAETYARDPGFYGSTFCCFCKTHAPVGEDGEFVWADDGSRVGT